MNAAGDNDMDINGVNGEAGGRSRPRSSRPNRSSNTEQNREALTNNQPHNDCGKQCDGTGGARPKVKHLYRNIPNGISPVNPSDEGLVKVNNNLPTNQTNSANFECGTRPSSSGATDERLNGLNFNRINGVEPNGVDSYLRNNVNCCTAVDKCPYKVRDCSNVSLGYNKTDSSSLKNNGYAKVDYSGRHHSGRPRPGVRWGDNDTSSSDTGNEAEEGSSEDECCIYTYKGDQAADLPSSFFRLDVVAGDQAGAVGGREEEAQANGDHSRSTSPEMDFLEMDFDPGPSCEQDSGEDSDRGSLRDEEADLPYLEDPSHGNENSIENCTSNDLSTAAVRPASPSINDLGNNRVQASPDVGLLGDHQQEAQSLLNPSWSLPHSCSTKVEQGCSSQRTTRDVWGHHCSSGDLCSPGDIDGESWNDCAGLFSTANSRIQGEDPRKSNLHSALYHSIMAKRLVLNKHASFSEEGESQLNPDAQKPAVERTMIWSEREACVKQVTQISTSACGATAVINVLLALNIPFNVERVKEGVGTRLRHDSAPLPEYLFSRSVAGATHVDLIRGLEAGSGGTLYARFFHTYPAWDESLSRWLAYWMKKGAVPIATLNLQHGVAPGNVIPDAWHHQMVFGVGPEGVYLTNPLEFVSESTLHPQLSSPSVLLVRRADVIARWHQLTDLRPLMKHPDIRWKKMNVLGQVANVVREWACQAPHSQGRVVTQHVAIPAAYRAGITLAISRESPAYQELKSAPSPAITLQY